MKKTLLVLVVIGAVLILAACNGDLKVASGGIMFYDAAVDTLPVMEPAAASRASSEWNFGNPVYEIFNTLREYDNDRDEGKIGLDNMYKLLFQAGAFYNDAVSSATQMETPRNIASPFDLSGDSNYVAPTALYTHLFASEAGGNWAAIEKAADGTLNCLMTWEVNQDSGDEYGIIEGNYNETTGKILLNLVCYVDYSSQPDYCLRTMIDGNDKTHRFKMKMSKYSGSDEGFAFSLTGSGVSQSANAEDFFLMAVLLEDTIGTTPAYYKVKAGAGETELQQQNAAGSTYGDLGITVDTYKTEVDALVAFPVDGSLHMKAKLANGVALE